MLHLRKLMGKLKLTVNEEKTRICKVPEGELNFLGYSFGRMDSARACPTRERVKTTPICVATGGAFGPKGRSSGGRGDDLRPASLRSPSGRRR